MWHLSQAFSLRPQLPWNVHKEAPHLPTWGRALSQMLSITHAVSLLHLSLPEVTRFIYLTTCLLLFLLFALGNHHHSECPNWETLWRAWTCCTQVPSPWKTLHEESLHEGKPHTHVFPRVVFCSLNPLIHLLFQLTQLHGCLVLGSEIQEDAHLFLTLLNL